MHKENITSLLLVITFKNILIYVRLLSISFLFKVIKVQFSHSVRSDSSDPMDCRMPGFPVHYQLLELAQIHFHWVSDNHPTISSSVIPFSSWLKSFPTSGSFPMGQVFASSGQSIEVSASAPVLPMNIQYWFPLGLTGLISLQSKELSRVFSNTTVQKHFFWQKFFEISSSVLSFLYSPALPSIHDYWKNHSLD